MPNRRDLHTRTHTYTRKTNSMWVQVTRPRETRPGLYLATVPATLQIVQTKFTGTQLGTHLEAG